MKKNYGSIIYVLIFCFLLILLILSSLLRNKISQSTDSSTRHSAVQTASAATVAETIASTKTATDISPDIASIASASTPATADSSHNDDSDPSFPFFTGTVPSKLGFRWDIITNGSIVAGAEYHNSNDDGIVYFGQPSEYSEMEGIISFRGNNFRNDASYGTADIREGRLQTVWSVNTGYIDQWTGVGWTGQPLIIKWDDSVRKIMNIVDGKKSSNDLKEVIYAALDGKIYFLDLADGLETRPPIITGYPYKGTASIDPRGYPLLYAGQGIDEINGKPVGIGYRIFNLLDQKQLYYIEGIDKYTLRYWGAFDSCPLIDKNTDTLLLCGENSLFYKIKLNTIFDIKAGRISINPEMIRYRYYSLKNLRLGIENSPAAFKDRIYFQDNEGVLQCVDINNLSPVWVRDVTDDSDSSVALDLESSGALSLYTACETDHQGNGYSYIRKINATDGSLIWEVKYECRYDGATNGGVLSSPLIGKNSISNLVIYSISKTVLCEGLLIAFDKDSGKEIWRKESSHYSWSSPVDIYTDTGTGYIIFCDSGGYMYLLDGKTGRTVDKISLGGAVEGSPAVYGNMVVIGTRGMNILGVRIY